MDKAEKENRKEDGKEMRKQLEVRLHGKEVRRRWVGGWLVRKLKIKSERSSKGGCRGIWKTRPGKEAGPRLESNPKRILERRLTEGYKYGW
jgi:hypothetical protein